MKDPVGAPASQCTRRRGGDCAWVWAVADVSVVVGAGGAAKAGVPITKAAAPKAARRKRTIKNRRPFNAPS